MEMANQIRQPGLGLAVFPAAPVAGVVSQLLMAKRAANRRECYVHGLAGYFRRFISGRENKPIGEFTAAEIETWLAQFESHCSRQTWLSRISLLFAFAVRRQFLASNPCKQLERVTVDRRAPRVLSPAECEKLLAMTPGVLRPYVILGLFAGIRPVELLKLDWSTVDLEAKTVTINYAKTRQRRIVPLEAKAVALLSACPLRRGPVSPSNSTVRRFKRSAVAALGLPQWHYDLLRHTAASYLLALHGDAGKVSTMLGNSSSILLRHYHEPVRSDDCGRFWGLAGKSNAVEAV
jgi:integrase